MSEGIILYRYGTAKLKSKLENLQRILNAAAFNRVLSEGHENDHITKDFNLVLKGTVKTFHVSEKSI